MKRRIVAIAAVAVLAVTACGSPSSSSLEVNDAWLRFAGENGAAYVTIVNDTEDADALIKASVPGEIASDVQIHQTTTSDGDMLGMQMRPSIDLPADFELKMSPGGYHIMLMDVKTKPAVGSTVPLTLEFEHHAPVTVDASVRS
jgi:copper(I)-binding protein